MHGELLKLIECCGFKVPSRGMRDFRILLLHAVVTVFRLARPGGLRSVVAESVLVKSPLGEEHALKLFAPLIT